MNMQSVLYLLQILLFGIFVSVGASLARPADADVSDYPAPLGRRATKGRPYDFGGVHVCLTIKRRAF